MISRFKRKSLFEFLRYFILTVWLLIVAFPLFWIVSTSLKASHEWITWPPVWWSEDPNFLNYYLVWISGVFSAGRYTESIGPWDAFINSLIIAFSASLFATFFGAIVAYAASRYKILTDTQLIATLLLRLVPPFVIAGPLLLWYSFIGLEDSRIGLILLYIITTIPFALLVLKSFVDDIPLEYEQAAEVLGARRFQVIVEIILPLLKPGLAVTFLFLFILNWSEFFLALILSKADVSTLPMYLNRFGGGGAYGIQAALSIGATLPLVIIGLFIRKHLVRGLTFGFVKRHR